MFYKSFSKKITAILSAAALLCSLAGCGNKETGSSAPESVSGVEQSVSDESSEAAQGSETSSDNEAVTVSQSADVARPIGNTTRDKLKPFTEGSFTVEAPVYPWTDGDVTTAWRMTDSYDNWTAFRDCVFLDFTGDGIPELLLVCGAENFYIFQKDGDTVSLSAQSGVDPHICNGVFLLEPPIEENEFDYAHPEKYYPRDKFAVFEDGKGQRYLVNYAWDGMIGLICEIKKIEIRDGEITFPVVYRWGLFKELGYDAMNIVMRYKKHLGDGNYEEIPKQEIEDHLKGLTIVTQLTLK